MANSSIKPKFGKCIDCPEISIPQRLVAGRCPYHYKVYRVKVANERRASQGELGKKANKMIKKATPGMGDWFEERREEMTGFCQCGCDKPSCRDSDKYYRHSCCHIFPKAYFKSVAAHPLNFVERAFWGGCHSFMDDGSVERWVNFADWPDIKNKVLAMDSLLTPEEKSRKFYQILIRLVYEN